MNHEIHDDAELQRLRAQLAAQASDLHRVAAEQKQIDAAQLFLAHSPWTASGEDFFIAIARYLAETLHMDYICIDRLTGDLLAAQTLAVYCDGKFEDNLAYTLKDTPCGDVVGKTICSFSQGVRHLFPKDAALQEMKAESYVGTTLWSAQGRPIGLIAVIGRQPLADLSLAQALVQLVAVRAAGELERRQVEIEREQLIVELQKALAEVKTLTGIIPICACCKKIRDDQGFWNKVESYIQKHSLAKFTHGLCPDCMAKFVQGIPQDER